MCSIVPVCLPGSLQVVNSWFSLSLVIYMYLVYEGKNHVTCVWFVDFVHV